MAFINANSSAGTVKAERMDVRDVPKVIISVNGGYSSYLMLSVAEAEVLRDELTSVIDLIPAGAVGRGGE